MLFKQLSIFLLLNWIVLPFNNFNQLKQDMQNKVTRIALAMQEILQHKCDNDTFQCPVKSFNICQGTGKRQCLSNFPTSKTCDGQSKYSPISGIRIPNSLTSFNLSDETKFLLCKTAQPRFQKVFKELLNQNGKSYTWLNFAFADGSHRVSPGFKYQKQSQTQSCKNYDPRLRPWFASTVYSRKKMVILVQNSRRIHQLPNRFMSIQLSIQALLKSSQIGDYFNIIEFSNSPRVLFSQEQLKLVSLNEQVQRYNKLHNSEGHFYEAVSENITKSQSSEVDYLQALQMAVQILANSKEENREYENFIMMFSGFQPLGYKSRDGVSQFQQFLSKKQIQHEMNFLFFGFGVNMIDDRGKQLLKNISCSFQGMFFQISDVKYESMFIDQAKGFYEYLSTGNQMQVERWTNFYEDAFGLGKTASVVKAAYYTQNGIKRFIGLACLDVLVSQLEVYKSQAQLKRQMQVTQEPFKKNISLCTLQTIRRKHRCMAPQQSHCPYYSFCSPKMFPENGTIIRRAEDRSQAACCMFQKSSNTGIIVGLVAGIGFGLLFIAIGIYCFIFRKNKQFVLDQTYTQIFRQFKDFDQTRIRSQSEISAIRD